MASSLISLLPQLIPLIPTAIETAIGLFKNITGNDSVDVSVPERYNGLSNPFFVGMPNPFSFNGLFSFINLNCR